MADNRVSLTLSNNRADVYILLYYSILGIVTLLLTKPNVEVGLLPRIIYLIAIVLPTFRYLKWLPFAVTAFYSISMCSFSPLLPSKSFIIIALFILPIILRQGIKFQRGIALFFLLLYFFVVDLFHFDIQELVWVSVILSVISMNCIIDKESLSIFAISFIFISVVLSLLYLTNYEAFLQQYGNRLDDMERSGWINPNVFGGHLSIGIVLAYYFIINAKERLFKIIMVLCVVVSMIALVLNASRGSFAAALLSIVVLTVFSGMKSRNKFFVVIIGLGLFFLAEVYGYFDLLQYRLSDETVGSAGSRFIIWENKIQVFFNNNPSVGDFLFGLGQEGCENLGASGKTHNDFVTSFIAYGLIGFILFVIILFRPLYLSIGKRKLYADAISFYLLLIIECLVLEPFFRGYFIYFMFYLFIAKYLEQSNIQHSIK